MKKKLFPFTALLLVCLVTLPLVFQRTNADSSLVGHWTFDEGSGDKVYDSSGKGNTGTIIGSASWVDGKYGKALHFEGGKNYVSVPHSDSLNIQGVHAFTLEAWVKPDDNQGLSGSLAENIIDKYSNYGLVFDHPNSDARGVIIRSNGAWYHSGQVQISSGVWHHYAGVYEPPYLIAYLDGVEAAKKNVGSLPLDTNLNNVVFGTNMELTSQYSGLIDEAKIFNRALSADEIRAQYPELSTSSTPLPIGLVGYWNFDEGSGTAVQDSSGYGNKEP